MLSRLPGLQDIVAPLPAESWRITARSTFLNGVKFLDPPAVLAGPLPACHPRPRGGQKRPSSTLVNALIPRYNRNPRPTGLKEEQ